MFECHVRRRHATFYIGAQAQDIDVVASALHTVYPETVLTECPDPRQDLKDVTVLFDLYSSEPHHRAVQCAHEALCRPFLHICDLLNDDDEAFYEVQAIPTLHAWPRNMAAMLNAERLLGHRAPQGQTITPKQLDAPLFSVVVRIGASTPRIARAMEALVGTFNGLLLVRGTG